MSITANFEFGAIPPDLLSYVKNKSKSSQYYFEYLLTRTKEMFQYKNLPDTIDHSILERMLMVNGICCITDYKGKLYAFGGSAGGEQDVYYRPSLFVISNPHFDDTFSKNVVISSQLTNYNNQPDDSQPGVLVRNDSEWIGLTPLIARYAVLMAENCVTIRSADIMLRIIALISANNDKSLKSAQDYLKKIENGDLGVIGTSQFQNSIDMQSPPSNNGSYLTQFIELQQYLKASFFNEIGLRANYNMKREALGEGETSIDEKSVLPLCENMLRCRREDMQKVNDLYGTNISVDFASAWLESNVSRNLAIISQLNESGAGKVETSEGENIDGKDTIDKEKDDGRTNGDNISERSSESTERTDSEIEGRVEGSEETDRERSGDNEVAEGFDTDSGREVKKGDILDDSIVNDINTDDLASRIEEHLNDIEIEKPDEPSQLMKGEEDGFLGETERTGNKTSTTDD